LDQLKPGAAFLTDDKLLLPVLEDDVLLFDYEDMENDESGSEIKAASAIPVAESKAPQKTSAEYEREIASLRARIDGLQSLVGQMRETLSRFAIDQVRVFLFSTIPISSV